jgi:phytoene synthase
VASAAGRDSLRRSHRYCEQIARTKAANFYPAFRLLPGAQYRAMCALYAFLRIADDLSDEPGDIEDKRQSLGQYRRQLDLALAGEYQHPLYPALADTVHAHRIPVKYLHAAIDGVAMDLDVDHYDTFDDLYLYCYRVASVVGLSCVHIWGEHGEEAKQYAESAGIAFQLTNILRDLAEDASRGRVYLPREDLERFGYSAESLKRGERGPAFEALMRFEAERARGYYDAAWPLVRLLDAPGRAVYLVMLRTYRGLLERIIASGFDVFRRRVRVSRWFKLWQVLRALPVRWGVAGS